MLRTWFPWGASLLSMLLLWAGFFAGTASSDRGINPWMALAVLAMGALAATGIGWLTARCLTDPLVCLADAMQAAGKGQFQQERLSRLRQRAGWNELGGLARACEQLSQQMEEMTRQAEQGRPSGTDSGRPHLFTRQAFQNYLRDADDYFMHDLSKPLNAILITAEELIQGPCAALEIGNEERDKIIASLRKLIISAKQQRMIIDSNKELFKFTSRKWEPQPQDFAIQAVVEDCKTVVEPEAEQAKIQIKAEGATESGQMHSDQVGVRRILVNLLHNAIEAVRAAHNVKKKEVRLRVSRSSNGDGGSEIVFTVEDTGKGMTEEEKNRLLKPYAEVRSRAEAKRVGSGLGLAFCQDMCKTLGGRIEVLQSRQNEGTTIEVHLPVRLNGR
jgi:signal transduction histidine kinase